MMSWKWRFGWTRTFVVGVLGMLSAAPVSAQVVTPYPTFKWMDKEHRFTASTAVDENVEMAAWTEDTGSDDAHWVYVAGWVTEMDGDTVVGTRFATYKYDAEANGTMGSLTPAATAYFPPVTESLSQGDAFKATGITVDQSSGDVYVVGEATSPVDGSQDYAVIRYTKNLVPHSDWYDASHWTTIARWYNNDDVDGDDIPADLTLDSSLGEIVVVTGTSPGEGTGLDIATVAWYTYGEHAGERVEDLWPATTEQPVAGVRRYDNLSYNGDDTAAELGPINIGVTQGDISSLNVIVLGTTYNGPSTLKDFTTHAWETGVDTDNLGTAWDQKFNLGGNDVATGIVGNPNHGWIWCVGYSEIPTNGVMSDPPNIDYSVASYETNGAARWNDHWDYYQSGQDFAFDIDEAEPDSNGVQVWITGDAQHGTRRDVGTIHYLDSTSSHTRDFTTGFNVGGSTTFNYGLAVFVSPSGLPYIAGANGTSSSRNMLLLKYEASGGSYVLDWHRTATGGTGFNEGRDIWAGEVEVPNYGAPNVYVTGVISTTANGREGATSRYRE